MQLTESSGSLVINKKRSILITDSRYTEEAQKEAPDFEVITLNKGIIEGLPEILSSLKTRVLGFEEDFLTWKTHGKLSRRLKRIPRPVRVTPLKGLIERLRLIKDRSEIKALEASADLMSGIIKKIIASLRPGLTEREIAWKIEGMARKRGAENLAFPSIVASGPNGALPHAVPSERKIRPKEPIIFDVGVKMNGYCSDMTRTIFLDTPGPKFRKIYRTVREAQLAALQEIRPGVKSSVPDAVARKIIKDAGFGDYFGHALGHGVGLATHEAPRLAPRQPVVLEEGMIVTVEPGIYIPGKGGVRLEEMVAIEKDGPRVLTKDNHYYDF
jgi:Xaa-Pro aminopeptidase